MISNKNIQRLSLDEVVWNEGTEQKSITDRRSALHRFIENIKL
jgi:hypothetical protein